MRVFFFNTGVAPLVYYHPFLCNLSGIIKMIVRFFTGNKDINRCKSY